MTLQIVALQIPYFSQFVVIYRSESINLTFHLFDYLRLVHTNFGVQLK